MLPLDADPVLIEARDITHELRQTRRALLTDCGRLYGDHAREQLARKISQASPRVLESLALEQAAELRHGLHHLALLQSRMDAILRVPSHREAIDRAMLHRIRALRVAALARRELATQREHARQAQALVSQVAASDRSLTAAEALTLDELHARGQGVVHWETQLQDPYIRDSVLSALGTVKLRRARQELRRGLLLTVQMRAIIAESLPALHRGDPLLLVGETGGAKTALAEYLAEHGMGLSPELVSGYGDITSSQVLGAFELRAVDGATTSVFVAGPLLRAMTHGTPVILDEINAMPPEFLKRLNRILQLRPGDRYAVQENAGRSVQIAPGFVVLATANEQTPHRYRGIDRLSAELVNRFGANSYRVHYPDAGASYTDFPAENALLAAASIVDQHGQLPRGVSADAIERVARAAFISQQVFSGSHGEGFSNFVSSEREIDGRPGLEESVLAPRTLVAVLRKVAGSAETISLDHALRRFIEGVMHREDRHVLALIFEGQGFKVR